MRIKVGFKVNEPLVDGFWLPYGVEGKKWIGIKYEKLQDFCFVCGKLGHLQKNCGEKVKTAVQDQTKMR